ncbi:hypothetical protein HYD90_02330 [Mycoplasmopsis bovis]|nr:hypothetical protein [Mycoplasmopsis bovis]QQH35935.1 hypothetical protein HYD90_02330 [Mycoplasmopsis bovis]
MEIKLLTFEVGNNKPENNVKLRLGIHEFDSINWEKFLKDIVASKYYIENNKGNHHWHYRWQFSNLQDNEQNVIITQIVIHWKAKNILIMKK